MTPANITQIDESAPMSHGGNLDEKALDAQQRRETHPFALYIEQVRKATNMPDSQSAREVVSEVCGAVARLTVVEKETIEAQAEHIASLVAEDRRLAKDPQLWEGPAKRIAQHALKLRAEGKGVVADSAQPAEA